MAVQLFFFFDVRKQPFYVPLDPSKIDFGNYNDTSLSYEATAIFMIGTFQFVVTCVAFSLAKPFRQPIYRNVCFLLGIIVTTSCDTAILFLPISSPVSQWFKLLPFVNETTGETYYSYHYWLALGVVVNSILTYGAEFVIVKVVASKHEAKMRRLKYAQFREQMEELKANQ